MFDWCKPLEIYKWPGPTPLDSGSQALPYRIKSLGSGPENLQIPTMKISTLETSDPQETLYKPYLLLPSLLLHTEAATLLDFPSQRLV